jgi:ketosteroid isomerase-like protein
MPTEDEVRKASMRFYVALAGMVKGDAHAMSDIWSHGSDVTAMHPIGGRQVGWDEVRESWEQVAGLASDGKVELNDQLIHATDDLAYEIGIEDAQFTLGGRSVAGRVRVTNVYQREAGGWKIHHHHTDLAPDMIEVLKGLQQ